MEGMQLLTRVQQPSPGQPPHLISPAIKSDGAESRSIRILSLIDGGSGPGDFDAPSNTVGDKDDIPDQNLPVYESSSRRFEEYQSLE